MENLIQVSVRTSVKKMAADLFTPVGIYLRLRDRFRDTILLESTDHHTSENSFSFIAINAIGGIEISSENKVEYKYPGMLPKQISLGESASVPDLVWTYMQGYKIEEGDKQLKFARDYLVTQLMMQFLSLKQLNSIRSLIE